METADHVTYNGVRERPYLIPSEITALRPQRSFTASISCVNHHPVILNQSTATRWVGICYPHPIRLHHTIEFLLSCDFQLTIQNIFSMESKEWFSCFRLIFFFFFFTFRFAGLQQIQHNTPQNFDINSIYVTRNIISS